MGRESVHCQTVCSWGKCINGVVVCREVQVSQKVQQAAGEVGMAKVFGRKNRPTSCRQACTGVRGDGLGKKKETSSIYSRRKRPCMQKKKKCKRGREGKEKVQRGTDPQSANKIISL